MKPCFSSALQPIFFAYSSASLRFLKVFAPDFPFRPFSLYTLKTTRCRSHGLSVIILTSTAPPLALFKSPYENTLLSATTTSFLIIVQKYCTLVNFPPHSNPLFGIFPRFTEIFESFPIFIQPRLTFIIHRV